MWGVLEKKKKNLWQWGEQWCGADPAEDWFMWVHAWNPPLDLMHPHIPGLLQMHSSHPWIGFRVSPPSLLGYFSHV